MWVISRKVLVEFWKKHPTAKSSLEQWYKVVKQATWQSFAEVRQTYSSADVVGERTVFNIAGTKFRLISYIKYKAHIVYIKAVLTHDEYDKGDWKK